MFQVRDFPEAMYTVEAIIMMHTHSKLSLASHLRRRQAKFSKCSHTQMISWKKSKKNKIKARDLSSWSEHDRKGDMHWICGDGNSIQSRLNHSTGCSIWIVTKVNEYCDYIFGVRHFSLQIYAANMCVCTFWFLE